MTSRADKYLSKPEHFAAALSKPEAKPSAPPDPDTLVEVMLRLRERYPDDDDFAAAMDRLRAELGGGEEGGEP